MSKEQGPEGRKALILFFLICFPVRERMHPTPFRACSVSSLNESSSEIFCFLYMFPCEGENASDPFQGLQRLEGGRR